MTTKKEVSPETEAKLKAYVAAMVSRANGRTATFLDSRIQQICQQYDKLKGKVSSRLVHLRGKLERCNHELSTARKKLHEANHNEVPTFVQGGWPIARQSSKREAATQVDRLGQEGAIEGYIAECKALRQELVQAIKKAAELKGQVDAERIQSFTRMQTEQHDEVKKLIEQVAEYLKNSKEQADDVKQAFADSLKALQSQIQSGKLETMMAGTIENLWGVLTAFLIIGGISFIILSIGTILK